MIQIGTRQVRNNPAEMTLGEFEDLSEILKPIYEDKSNTVEAWVQAMVFMGADEDELDAMTPTQFGETVHRFNWEGVEVKQEFAKTFSAKGVDYTSYESEEFQLSTKDLKWIQKFNNSKGQDPKMSTALAVIFKADGMTNNEHYNLSAIKHKVDVFRETMPATVAIPFAAAAAQEMLGATVASKGTQDGNTTA